MTTPKSIPLQTVVPDARARLRQRMRRTLFGTAFVLLALAFAPAAVGLVRFSLHDSLYSHVPLVPLVCAYLLWTRRRDLPAPTGPSWLFALLSAVAAAALLIALLQHRTAWPLETRLGAEVALFLCGLVLLTALTLGRPMLRFGAWPLGFSLFAIPLPPDWLRAAEAFLQHGSAQVARVLFVLAGTATYYENLTFELPGFRLFVAPECSGVHSTLALLMVSLLAGYGFLRSHRHIALLAGAVLPLGLLRNGFRIFVIGELCVHRGPAMINSPIHRQGGPVFFVVSLLPLLALLGWLARREKPQPENRLL